ncbi:MAG: DNA translocase FtsK 4TM domain-containing protein, partial [Gemmatimonadaceae bacterium]
MGGAQLKRELAGVALIVFALFLAAAIAVGPEPGSVTSCWHARGLMGPVGACLRASLYNLIGLPATILIPFVPAVHALRLFGRMRSDTDRSWMLFLAGATAVLPIALGIAVERGTPAVGPFDGVWGSFAAFYLHKAFGPAGAWFVVALLVCGFTVLTLAWNPIRVLIGVRMHPSAAAGESIVVPEVPTRGRKKRAKADAEAAIDPVLREPLPEEMPQVDPMMLQ